MYDSLTSKITRISKLKNWDAQKQGIYRYSDDNGIRFSGSQYEILILHHEENSDILTAKAMLFFIEDPFWKRGSFNRKVLLTGTVSDCLEKAGEVLMSQNTSKETLEYSFFASLGFERMESPKGEAGYTKMILQPDSSERLWITINPKTRELYLYKEFLYDGKLFRVGLEHIEQMKRVLMNTCLWRAESKIPEKVLSDKKSLVDWLDYKINCSAFTCVG